MAVRSRRRTARRVRRGHQKVVVNAGSGPAPDGGLPAFFESWRQVRVDLDPASKPDIVASIVDLREIPDGTVDAVWSSHCIEHLFAHDVPKALSEFRRVLARSGFAIVIVPDLQAIASWIAEERLDETVYVSAAGPITPHDMLWGFGRAIERGHLSMAHRCGFTPASLLQRVQDARFRNILLRRRSSWDIVALMLRSSSGGAQHTNQLIYQLGL